MLIVVEGLDRSGKSSQCQILHDKLSDQGEQVRYVKFPGMIRRTWGKWVTMLRSEQTELLQLGR